ncbi:hypothetical protein H5410_042548 [Solanum commersonii]|uniref:Uncharacterized protein n=1 Tax=Solanum commersonii TaxID=4109 RepID=A0A9J5XWB7_SOLCO|nr:hypothetical protein H5410_042548 [Solanum commersonii]
MFLTSHQSYALSHCSPPLFCSRFFHTMLSNPQDDPPFSFAAKVKIIFIISITRYILNNTGETIFGVDLPLYTFSFSTPARGTTEPRGRGGNVGVSGNDGAPRLGVEGPRGMMVPRGWEMGDSGRGGVSRGWERGLGVRRPRGGGPRGTTVPRGQGVGGEGERRCLEAGGFGPRDMMAKEKGIWGLGGRRCLKAKEEGVGALEHDGASRRGKRVFKASGNNGASRRGKRGFGASGHDGASRWGSGSGNGASRLGGLRPRETTVPRGEDE